MQHVKANIPSKQKAFITLRGPCGQQNNVIIFKRNNSNFNKFGS